MALATTRGDEITSYALGVVDHTTSRVNVPHGGRASAVAGRIVVAMTLIARSPMVLNTSVHRG